MIQSLIEMLPPWFDDNIQFNTRDNAATSSINNSLERNDSELIQNYEQLIKNWNLLIDQTSADLRRA